MNNLQAAANPILNTDSVAVRFELGVGSAVFANWSENDSLGQKESDGDGEGEREGDQGVDEGGAGGEKGGCKGGWRTIGDFTGGEARNGGRCEVTGERDVSLSNPSIPSSNQTLLSPCYPSLSTLHTLVTRASCRR